MQPARGKCQPDHRIIVANPRVLVHLARDELRRNLVVAAIKKSLQGFIDERRYNLPSSPAESMPYYNRVVLYFDGASRNNPQGPAAYGWVLHQMNEHGADDGRIASDSQFLGYNVSSNQAEYAGLVAGLSYIRDNIQCKVLYIRGDSELVVKQMTGDYQVRSRNLLGYYNQSKAILGRIDCGSYSFRHIARYWNWEADRLAKSRL
jgi:ribonuclease HI